MMNYDMRCMTCGTDKPLHDFWLYVYKDVGTVAICDPCCASSSVGFPRQRTRHVTMEPWMKDAGIAEEATSRAKMTLKHLMLACRAAGNADFVRLVLREAEFRVFELSKRTEEYQLEYLKENT